MKKGFKLFAIAIALMIAPIAFSDAGQSLYQYVKKNSDAALKTLTMSGKVTKYNNIATAGMGVSPIYAYGSLAAVTTNATTITTYTPPANGVYEIGGLLDVTAWTSGNVAIQLAYTGCDSVARSGLTLFGHRSTDGSNSNVLPGLGALSLNTISFCAQSGAAIVLKTSLAAGTTADFYGFIRQVN